MLIDFDKSILYLVLKSKVCEPKEPSWGVLQKKLFLKILQYSQENICIEVS